MTTITKELSQQDLRAKLERGGMLARRPDLALMIMSGQCAYEERTVGQAHGENFALRGSPAATYVTKDLQPEQARSAPAAHVSDAEVERRLEEIRSRNATRGSGAPSTQVRNHDPDASSALVRAAQPRADREADEASDDFIRSARAAGDGLSAATGDASTDLLRAVESRATDDFNPFDFGGAA